MSTAQTSKLSVLREISISEKLNILCLMMLPSQLRPWDRRVLLQNPIHDVSYRNFAIYFWCRKNKVSMALIRPLILFDKHYPRIMDGPHIWDLFDYLTGLADSSSSTDPTRVKPVPKCQVRWQGLRVFSGIACPSHPSAWPDFLRYRSTSYPRQLLVKINRVRIVLPSTWKSFSYSIPVCNSM